MGEFRDQIRENNRKFKEEMAKSNAKFKSDISQNKNSDIKLSKNFKTMFLLIFLLPIGLIYMFKKSGWSSKSKSITSVVVAAFVGLIVYAGINASPSIEVANMQSGHMSRIDDDRVEVKGKIIPHSAALEINGRRIDVDSDGEFVAKVDLKEGENYLVFKAVKDSDKVTYETYKVRRTTAEELNERERALQEEKRLAEEKAAQEKLDKEREELNESREKEKRRLAEEKQRKRNYWHKVTGVKSGDVLLASVDGREQVVRLIGVDSPKPGQCFADESRAKMQEFLTNKWVQLEDDASAGERDQDGNILAYVWFDGGTDLGRRLVEEGYANSLNASFAKDSQYEETEAYSKSKQHGLWSDATCKGSRQIPKPVAPPPAPTYQAPKPAQQPKTAPAPQNAGQGVVKKSVSGGICHAPGTTYYDRTKNYSSYNSIDECLSSGGRLPKR